MEVYSGEEIQKLEIQSDKVDRSTIVKLRLCAGRHPRFDPCVDENKRRQTIFSAKT